MAVYTWTGANNTAYSNPLNWLVGGVVASVEPTAADEVQFGTAFTGGTNTNCVISVPTRFCRAWTVNTYTGAITISASTEFRIGDASAPASGYAINFVTTGWTLTIGNSASSQISLVSTSAALQYINTGNKTTGRINVSGVGASFQLASNITSSEQFTLNGGSFADGGFTVTAGLCNISNSNVRSLSKTSNWKLTGTSGTVWTSQTTSNLTLVSFTGDIEFTGTSGTRGFVGGGLTYPSFTWTSGGQVNISGTSTFTTMTLGGGTLQLATGQTQTIKNLVITATGGSHLTIRTSVSGTRSTLAHSGAGAVEVDYVEFQDVQVNEPYHWYLGANSVDLGNNLGPVFTARPPGKLYLRQSNSQTYSAVTSATILLRGAPLVGQLLNVVVGWTANPGTVTGPAGWTQVTSTLGANGYFQWYYRIADGSETGFTITTTTARNPHIFIEEIAGFSGAPVLETFSTSNFSATTSYTTPTVSNATSKGWATAAVSFNGGSGGAYTGTVPTNSFQEDLLSQGSSASLRVAERRLDSPASQSTTLTWTSNRANVGAIVVFKDTGVSSNFLMFA